MSEDCVDASLPKNSKRIVATDVVGYRVKPILQQSQGGKSRAAAFDLESISGRTAAHLSAGQL